MNQKNRRYIPSKKHNSRQIFENKSPHQRQSSQEKKLYFQYGKQMMEVKDVEETQVKEVKDIEVKDVDEKQQKIELKGVQIFEDDFQQFFTNYLEQLEEWQRKNYAQNLDLHWQEFQCFQFIKDGLQLGIAIVYFDKDYFLRRRLQLAHFSTLKDENLSICFPLLIQHLYDNDPCQEIRVHIQHQIINDNLQIHPTLQDILKTNNFKWKQLINDKTTNQRSTIFGIMREYQNNKEQIMITSKGEIGPSKRQKDQFYTKICDIVLAKKVGNDFYNHYNLPDDFDFQGIKYEENFNRILLNVCYRWQRYKVDLVNGKNYLRFDNEKEEQIYYCNFGEKRVYLISTDDSNVSVFLSECESQIDDFDGYVESLFQNCQDQEVLQQNLLFPCFKYEGKKSSKIDKQNINRELSIYCDRNSNLNGNLLQRPNPKNVILKFPFIFGLVHFDIATLINSPLIATIVKQCGETKNH